MAMQITHADQRSKARAFEICSFPNVVPSLPLGSVATLVAFETALDFTLQK